MSVNSQIDKIFEEWNRTDSPGMAIAVKHEGKITYRAYGMADLDHGIHNEPSTVFHCASLAKQFTAMCILVLERAGKLKRSDYVYQHLPKLPELPELQGRLREVTIEQLLRHTSGIRDMLIQLTLAGWRWGDDAITRSDVLKLISRMQTLNFVAPGETFAYSNTNYFLASEIVRHRSDMSLADFARENVFRPLGMNSTGFVETYGQTVTNRAYGYKKLESTKYVFEKRMPNYDLTGPTNLLTTVEDLMQWDANFDSPGREFKEAVAAMQEPAENSNGYGLGLFVVKDVDNNTKTVWHDGRTIGHRAHFVRYNSDKISIALLCNVQFTNKITTDQLVYAVKKVVLGRKPPALTFLRLPERPNVELRGGEVYAGKYYSAEIDTEFEVAWDEPSSLEIKRPKYPPSRLTPLLDGDEFDDRFIAQDFTDVLKEVEIKFSRKDDRSIDRFSLNWSSRLEGPRLMDFLFVKKE